jgi:hypothetical protein
VLRNSSTSRRWRSSVIDPPTTAGSEQGEVGDLRPNLLDRAGLLGFDLASSPDAQAPGLASGDVGVRLLGRSSGHGPDLVDWRRASASADTLESKSRSRGPARRPEALLDSIAPLSMADTGLNANA